jgi:hypothetical protein
MDRRINITPACELKNVKSTWPYKLEKKGKALDQVEGQGSPGRNK